MNPPELRRNITDGRWVIVSSDRGKRPSDFHSKSIEVPSENTLCHFCPGNEKETPPELAVIENKNPDFSASKWKKRIFASINPIVSPEIELERQGEGMFDMMTGFGVHEVIVNTPLHNETLASMSLQDLTELIILWRDRLKLLRSDSRLHFAMLFGNRGEKAGAAMSHSHSQIIATPTLPRRVAVEISTGYEYFHNRERCVFCDLFEFDRKSERLVWSNEDYIVVCPYAPRFPYELWLIPENHQSHFDEIDGSLIPSLAEAFKIALTALNKTLDDPPYSFVLHSAPLNEKGMVHYHWHFEIMPRLSNVAGFEWGTGFYINSVPPESAAAAYKENIT